MHAAGPFLIGAAIGMSVIGFPMLERIRKLEVRLRVASNMPPLWGASECHVWTRHGPYDWQGETDR